MADIKTLREQMANIATEARSKLNEVSDKTDETRAAEVERQFDAMMIDHDKLAGRIERLEKLDAAEARAQAVDMNKRPVPVNAEARGVDAGKQIAYREAFFEMIANGGTEGLDADVRGVLRSGAIQKHAHKLLALIPLVVTLCQQSLLTSSTLQWLLTGQCTLTMSAQL
jgi:HK97 family phage major capsid protein